VVACPTGHIPWDRLRDAIVARAGIDPLTPAANGGGLRFLVVGCHTEGRVLALALFLRHFFRCDEVAISHHLVGSSIPEAHLAVLRHTLPALGIKILLDLAEVARFANLLPDALSDASASPCVLEPLEVRELLGDEQRQIVERLCMHWTRARLRSLGGGFSGSLLLMAEGWKGEARTEPMVLKIDAFRQMRKELAGYYLIKDFLGKNVPTFGYPVSVGDWLGVGMELAAKEGTPETLQDVFQRAEDEDGTRHFYRRLDKTLELLVDKLLQNTRESDWVVPYRDFGLHTEDQQRWLRQNAELIQGYLSEAKVDGQPERVRERGQSRARRSELRQRDLRPGRQHLVHRLDALREDAGRARLREARERHQVRAAQRADPRGPAAAAQAGGVPRPDAPAARARSPPGRPRLRQVGPAPAQALRRRAPDPHRVLRAEGARGLDDLPHRALALCRPHAQLRRPS
jgi:hypothetical protein